MKRKVASGICLVMMTIASSAQRQGQGEQQAAPATGSVSGRVICSDTQRPARFAEVMLTAVASDGANQRGRQRMAVRTDLEGMFTANIAAGDYYVTGNATGYISQSNVLQAGLEGRGSITPSADALAALARLPVVHVSAGVPSIMNLTLDRGAVIAGKLTWDDGSPAAGVVVSAVAQTESNQGNDLRAQFAGFGGFGTSADDTDDRGQFRLNGLTPGTYIVRAVVHAETPALAGASLGVFERSNNVLLYAPGKMRKAEAAAITVGAGEERVDVLFVLDLRLLHRLSGHVSAASGGVTIGSGTVRMVDSQDSSLLKSTQIGADGSYMMTYVPAGTYTLSVMNAGPPRTGFGGGGRGRPEGGSPSTPAVTFQPFQETVTVTDTDVSGVNVELTPQTGTGK